MPFIRGQPQDHFNRLIFMRQMREVDYLASKSRGDGICNRGYLNAVEGRLLRINFKALKRRFCLHIGVNIGNALCGGKKLLSLTGKLYLAGLAGTENLKDKR